jgi:predicted P-loop ATPase
MNSTETSNESQVNQSHNVNEWQSYYDKISRYIDPVNRMRNDDDQPLPMHEAGIAALGALAMLTKDAQSVKPFISIMVKCLPINEEDQKSLLTRVSEGSGITRSDVVKLFKGECKRRNSDKRSAAVSNNMYKVGIKHTIVWHTSEKDEDGEEVAAPTHQNTEALAKAMGLSFRVNTMAQKLECDGIGGDHKLSTIVTIIKSACAVINYKARNDIYDHIDAIASGNRYHPVKEWLDGIKWDGVSRLDDLARQLESPMDDDLKKVLVRKWMLGAVQLIYTDKPDPLQGVLVLQGGQGLGKSTWLKSLCPVDGAIADGKTIDPRNKDSVIESTRYWIVELGELDATFRKADISALKAFITQEYDEYRAPYERASERHVRRTAFTASVNQKTFLADGTGNRRYWTIELTNIEYNKLDMGQVWAEVLALFREGEQWRLTPEELDKLNSGNEKYEMINDYKHAIEQLYGKASDYPKERLGDVRMLMKDLYTAVMAVTGDRDLSMVQKSSIKNAMTQAGFEYKFSRRGGKNIRGWELALESDRRFESDPELNGDFGF